MKYIVFSNFLNFISVCSMILSHANSSEDENDFDTATRTKALKMLCNMNPRYRKTLRAECVSLCKLAGLSIELTINSKEPGIQDHISLCLWN